MKNEQKTIRTESLPKRWSEILGEMECGDVRIFPMQGQALNNARHAITRMKGKRTLRTKAKGNTFFVFCTAHLTDSGERVKITRSGLQQIYRYIAFYPRS